MANTLQQIAETSVFQASAKNAGLTDGEKEALITMLAMKPDAGVIIPGSGGCRKVRIAREGGGKSGGYRVITIYGGGHMPLYLLACLAKNQDANFSAAQIANLCVMAKRLLAAHRPRAVS